MKAEVETYLENVAKEARDAIKGGAAPSPQRLTVRDLLRLSGYARRGSGVVSEIRNALEKHGLRTLPDFENTWIDGAISVELDRESANGSVSTEAAVEDPTVRIDALAAAHRTPTVVDPDSPLEAATTLMLLNDYSQLPVTKNRRKIQGMISWKSIGSRLSSGVECSLVRHCVNPEVKEVRLRSPLLDAVADIATHGYTLVRADGEIVGIVTTSDLSREFLELASPFLLIGEIERYLHILAHGRFTREELQAVLPGGLTASGTADLTLGGYCRLLQNPEHWEKLHLRFSRGEFIRRLEEVRNIRNDVVHFRPDGLAPENLQVLQGLVAFLRHLARMGVVEHGPS
ncbi:MAG: CBS domain-containing protein [Acidobacteriota bacterium]|nr:CBS domain-containing protein [Acidobacteriota bacterium]